MQLSAIEYIKKYLFVNKYMQKYFKICDYNALLVTT